MDHHHHHPQQGLNSNSNSNNNNGVNTVNGNGNVEEGPDGVQVVSGGRRVGGRKAVIMGICGSLVYYHCGYRESSLLSLLSDVFIVLLCSLAILGLLFRQMNIQVPVDPLEWQISQDTANTMFACLANTVGATESVLRVAATGHDKRLFLKVAASLYILSALGRLVSGVTVAYAGLCLFCLYILVQNSSSICPSASRLCLRRESTSEG